MKHRQLLTGRKIFFGLLIAVTIFRLYYSTKIPLSGDEAYHWEWSRHLAFGYYDHPPLIAWFIAFFTMIGGPTLFWIRITAVLAVTGVTYLTYRLGRDIGGETVGVTSGIFSLAVTAMAFGALIVSTDSPLLFFWQLTVYLVWRALNTEKSIYWYYVGIALGFGLLSKFLIIPLLGGIFLFLLLSTKDRYWLKRKEPYLSLGIALLIFSPFLVWNAQNGWTSFVFHFTRHNPEFSFIRPLQFLAMEAALLSPVLLGGMLWSIFSLFRMLFKPGEPEGKDRRTALFILLTAWLLPGFFLINSLRSSIGAHWPVAAYGTAMVGLAWLLSRKQNRSTQSIIGGWFWGSAALWTVLIIGLTFTPSTAGKLLGQDPGDAYGWEEIGGRVNELYKDMDPNTIVATKSYAFSSLVSFYTPDRLYVSVIGPYGKHGRAYDLWDHWQDWIGRDVLVVSKDDPREPGSKDIEILKQSCASYKLIDIIQIKHQGKIVRKVFCILGHNLKGDLYASVRRQYRWNSLLQRK